MQRDEARVILNELIAAFPEAKLSEERIKLYLAFFELRPFDDLSLAVMRILGTSRFFPTIAEIMDAYVASKIDWPSAEEAWEEVAARVQRDGYLDPDPLSGWSHELIQRTVRTIRWESICTAPERVVAAQFRDTYKAFATTREHNLRWSGTALEKPDRGGFLTKEEEYAQLPDVDPYALPAPDQLEPVETIISRSRQTIDRNTTRLREELVARRRERAGVPDPLDDKAALEAGMKLAVSAMASKASKQKGRKPTVTDRRPNLP